MGLGFGVWGLEFGFIDLFSARSLAVIFYYTFLLAVGLFVCCWPGLRRVNIFCWPFSATATVSLFVFNFSPVGDFGAAIKTISWL